MLTALQDPVVIVFGAGATVAEAIPRRRRKRLFPPLDTDFFERAHALAPGRGALTSHLASLAAYVRSEYGVDITARPTPRMEQIAAWVFSDALVTPGRVDAQEAYRALLHIYRDVIARTTDAWDPGPRGPTMSLLRAMADQQRALTCITFNQDLLIERALDSLAVKHAGLWNLHTGYGEIRFQSFTQPVGGRRPRDMFRGDAGTASAVRLLKLHGSLNWYVTSRGRQPPMRLPSRRPFCSRRRSLPDIVTYRGRGRRQWTWPVIVPPVADKGAMFSGILAELWAQAETALREARSLVLFGYSFPDTDVQAETLFRRACSRASLEHVVVVNTDLAVGAKSWRIVGGQSILQCRTISHMLRHHASVERQ